MRRRETGVPDVPLPPVTQTEALIGALLDTRAVELALLEHLSDDQLLGQRAHFLEPPIWEMGHVGWFQEQWISRRLDGHPTLLPGSDAIYDSFNVSYTKRWEHRFPSRRETCDYITAVLRDALAADLTRYSSHD